MAGFEVITYGRFWVIAEGPEYNLASGKAGTLPAVSMA
jgi:hypothetical protein